MKALGLASHLKVDDDDHGEAETRTIGFDYYQFIV